MSVRVRGRIIDLQGAPVPLRIMKFGLAGSGYVFTDPSFYSQEDGTFDGTLPDEFITPNNSYTVGALQRLGFANGGDINVFAFVAPTVSVFQSLNSLYLQTGNVTARAFPDGSDVQLGDVLLADGQGILTCKVHGDLDPGRYIDQITIDTSCLVDGFVTLQAAYTAFYPTAPGADIDLQFPAYVLAPFARVHMIVYVHDDATGLQTSYDLYLRVRPDQVVFTSASDTFHYVSLPEGQGVATDLGTLSIDEARLALGVPPPPPPPPSVPTPLTAEQARTVFGPVKYPGPVYDVQAGQGWAINGLGTYHFDVPGGQINDVSLTYADFTAPVSGTFLCHTRQQGATDLDAFDSRLILCPDGTPAGDGLYDVALQDIDDWYTGAGPDGSVTSSYPDGETGYWSRILYECVAGVSYRLFIRAFSPVYPINGNLYVTRFPGEPVSLSAASRAQLQHVGFSPRQAEALDGSPTFKELLRAGFSTRQTRTLLKGDLSMKALLRGGFTRAQAKLLGA